MPRPKKEKSLPAADDSQPSMMDAGIDADPSEGSAARPSPVADPRPPPSPGGRVLEEAKYNYEEALMKSRWLDELAKKAKAKERLAERLSDAKFKRSESKQKRKPKDPYVRCTRMYEALIEEQQAKLESRWYAEKAARGEVEVFACRVAVLQLENARLKRQLRRYS